MEHNTLIVRRTYTVPVQTAPGLDTPEGVEAVRAKLARTSAGYQAATTNPWGILPATDDIPF